jgi:hypothetical protein
MNFRIGKEKTIVFSRPIRNNNNIKINEKRYEGNLRWIVPKKTENIGGKITNSKKTTGSNTSFFIRKAICSLLVTLSVIS